MVNIVFILVREKSLLGLQAEVAHVELAMKSCTEISVDCILRVVLYSTGSRARPNVPSHLSIGFGPFCLFVRHTM
jgi:hypothetical protein